MKPFLPSFVDTLPLHPQPEAWESLSSYMTRLAHMNKIGKIKHLWRLCFPQEPHDVLSQYLEAASVSLNQLAVLTACTEAQLRQTTCYHIRVKFGLFYPPSTSGDFFRASIGHTLRFCPHCIAELPYSSLLWRFSALDGCVHHRCRLVSSCTSCRRTIPLVSPAIATLQCPDCSFELRHCTSMVLTDIQLEYTSLILRDLEYLLTPAEEEAETPVMLQHVGARLASQRHHAGLTYADIIPILRIPHWALQAMEAGPSPRGRASFAMYLQYAYYLGLNLADLFASSVQQVPPIAPTWTPPCIHVAAYHQALLRQPPEPLVHDADTVHDPITDPLLVTVDHALMTLTATGASPTLAALSDMINVPLDILACNPQVRTLCLQYAAARRAAQRRYWRWATYVAVQEAIHALHEQKQPIALYLICQHTRSTPEALMYYPETATLLEELTKIPQRTCMVEHYERALTQRVEVARSRLAVQVASITWILLARDVGVAPSGLQQYAVIRCMCNDLAE